MMTIPPKRPEIIRTEPNAGPRGELAFNSFESIKDRADMERAAKEELIRSSKRQKEELEAAKREAEIDMGRHALAKHDIPIEDVLADREMLLLKKRVENTEKALALKDDDLKKMRDELDWVMGENKRTDDMLDKVEGTGYIVPRRVSRDRLSISWDCPLPFDWYWSGAKTVTVKMGSIRVNSYRLDITGGIAVVLNPAGSGQDVSSAATTALTLPDSAGASDRLIYLHYHWQLSAFAVTVEQGAALPVNENLYSTSQDFYVKLYTFSTLGDGSTGADARYVLSKVHRFGDWELTMIEQLAV